MLFLTLVLVSALLSSIATMPVIYPNPSKNTDLYIHDDFRGTLIRHPGSMESFFCDNCPTDDDVTLYTTSDHVDILVAWLNSQGNITPFKRTVTIRALGTNRRHVEPPHRNATVALSISPLPRIARVELLVISDTWQRRVRVVKDTRPTRIQIELIKEEETPEQMQYMIIVSFSKKVVWKPRSTDCPPMGRISKRKVNVTMLLDQSKQCDENLLQRDIRHGIDVKGGSATMIIWGTHTQIVIPISIFNKKKSEDVEITVKEGFADFAGQEVKGGKRRILYYRPFPPIRERQGRLLGRDVLFPTKVYFDGKVVGQVASVMVAGTSAVTLATSAGSGSGSGGSVSMINNVQKLHMTDSSVSVIRCLKEFDFENGIALSQTVVALIIVVPSLNLPFFKFWRQLNMTSDDPVFSEKNTVGNDTIGNATVNGTATGRSLKVVDAAFELQDDEDEFQYFNRIMFWIPVIFIVVIVLHLLILAWFVLKEREIPVILQPPRLELMLMFFSLPPVAIASAGLYKQSLERAFLGTWLLIAWPVNFLVWNLFMIWYYILRVPPHLREVNLITDVPNKKQRALRRVRQLIVGDGKNRRVVHHRRMESLNSTQVSSVASTTEPMMIQMADRSSMRHLNRGNTMHGVAVVENRDGDDMSEADSQTARSCGDIIRSISNMPMLTLLFGEHQNEAEWMSTKSTTSTFSARFGVLFEEHRGPSIGRRNVTLDVDPVTGRVDRGELVIFRERPLVVLPAIGRQTWWIHLKKSKIYRHHLQLLAKLLDITKTILVGCIVAGVGDTDDNVSSIVALIALSLILILLLRIAKPFPSRLDMLLLLLAEVADLIVYTCALFLVLGPNTTEDTDQNIGMALLLSEAFALLATILEYSLISIGLGLGGYEEWKNRKNNKFFTFVHQQIFMKDEIYLTKKYADKWMVRTLSRGINGRIPQRHELPWKRAMKRELMYLWNEILWWLGEIHMVWLDAQNKRRAFLSRTRNNTL